MLTLLGENDRGTGCFGTGRTAETASPVRQLHSESPGPPGVDQPAAIAAAGGSSHPAKKPLDVPCTVLAPAPSCLLVPQAANRCHHLKPPVSLNLARSAIFTRPYASLCNLMFEASSI